MNKPICKQCTKPFKPTNNNPNKPAQRYCSIGCSNKSRIIRSADKGERPCYHCKKTLDISDFYRPHSNYCRPCEREMATKWYNNNREKALRQRKIAHIRRKYGLSEDEYSSLIDNGCAICLTKERLVVDHSHKTGKTRGVLCNRCNAGLGQFLDNVGFLKEAVRYLEA